MSKKAAALRCQITACGAPVTKASCEHCAGRSLFLFTAFGLAIGFLAGMGLTWLKMAGV